jgi:uncharacterized protein (DUF488 family)
VASAQENLRIFTIGHSNRKMEDFIKLLIVQRVTILADVRSFPRSYRNPQFNTEAIGPELSKYQIEYLWLQKLGGRRKGLGEKSKNTCWKNKSFRNYADYMETTTFRDGIDELIALAKKSSAAIMCAEAVYWRCHRCMIADFLKAKGIQVMHILNEKPAREHEYTTCAKVIDGELTYH